MREMNSSCICINATEWYMVMMTIAKTKNILQAQKYKKNKVEGNVNIVHRLDNNKVLHWGNYKTKKKKCQKSSKNLETTKRLKEVNLLNSLFTKNNMPQKFHHSPTRSTIFIRLGNPLTKTNIILPRTTKDLIS